MSNLDQPPSASSSTEQSPGTDPRSKRNSGLFAFFKWFKPGSRESIDSTATSRSSSQESISSNKSNKSVGTVASFNFVPPSAYEKIIQTEKCVQIGPETDTYKARLKQRDKRRESDKNVTLRKKYNLFFNRETLLRSETFLEDEENSKSLPLMTRTHIMEAEPQKVHRRTNSESSKVKRAGAYVHVKGKRKAPQPPGGAKLPIDTSSTASLKRKKRLAPTPPPSKLETPPKVEITTISDNDLKLKGILSNDYLKLDHGVLKPVREDSRPRTPQENITVSGFNALSPSSSRTSFVEAPVSPRPWYKRNSASREMLNKKENKYEPIERLPEVQFKRNSTLDLTLEDSIPNNEKEKKKEEKRKSGMSFLTNISELDREASEIIKNKAEYEKKMGVAGIELGEIPEFMKPKETKPNDSWVSPKRRSARDLIAKFNAITNVTKVTVFGASHKDKYFGKQTSWDETRQRQEQLLESHKKRIEEIDKKNEDRFSPLMKSESASAVKLGAAKDDTPKMERKSWKCPKCNLENEYWRIICHVCSAIKPYFDDFSSSSKINGDFKAPEVKTSSPLISRKEPLASNNSERIFERAKTQIGFSALASYNANNKKKMETAKSTSSEDKDRSKVDDASKKEERDRLKKMLIEMKNSLPKRKSNLLIKQNSRTSIIMENPEGANKELKETNKDLVESSKEDKKEVSVEKTQEEKVAEILIGTTETIYENIKIRRSENIKPVKVSSAAQTSAVVKQIVPENTLKKLIENHKANNVYEPMKAKDFEDIYSDKNGKSVAKIYANLAQNDELSLFFNVPKNIADLKNNLSASGRLGACGENSPGGQNNVNFNVNTDTIEINRLLRRLETAIAKGDMTEAAIFAKELAQLKVNCSVIRQKPQGHVGKKIGFQIEMYVEDKVSHRGPFPIDVTGTQTVTELKQQISREFEIPVEVQRWILGKELVTDDSSTLKDHKITEGCPVFLYLVAAEKKKPDDHLSRNKAQPSTSNSNVQQLDQKPQNKPELTTSAKIGANNIPIPVANVNNNNREALKLEPIEKNSPKELNQEKKIENIQNNATGQNKPKEDVPKVVSVIPKSSEAAPKAEVVRIISMQKETPSIKPAKEEDNSQKTPLKVSDNISTQLPISVTEIKVDIRPYTSRSKSVESKDQKTALVKAKSTKVEVLQAPSLVTTSSFVNQQNSRRSSVVFTSNKTENMTPTPLATNSFANQQISNQSSVIFTSNKTENVAFKPLDTHLKQECSKTADVKTQNDSKVLLKFAKPLNESKTSNTCIVSTVDNTSSSSKISSQTSTSNNFSRIPQVSIGIYPNLSKLSPNLSTNSPSASTSNVSSTQYTTSSQASISSSEKAQNAQAPIAQKEQEFEDYDSNTLKPVKEWECHLCTLLNPISSNICAVCATVRLKKTSLKRSNKKKPAPQPQKDQTYLQLVNLDSADLVPNADVFECVVCFLDVPRGEGATLRECLHQFCKDCLARTVEFSEDAEVKCPYRDDEYSCNIALQDREIKALVTKAVYDQYLAKSVAQAENKMEKTFHCKTPDCKGWCIFEDNVNEFRCPVCRRMNCLTCQAIHTGLNCRQYQERMKDESEIDEEAKRTKDFLEEMVEKGEAIACPTCKVILMKKWGCDWLRCSMCKTEICWVTRGPRWGPGGKGDTTGGCQCGLNGVKCHPKCNYCH